MLNLWNRNFTHGHSESANHFDSSFNPSANLLVKTFFKIFAENTDFHALEIIGERTLIAWDRPLRARRVSRVPSRQSLRAGLRHLRPSWRLEKHDLGSNSE